MQSHVEMEQETNDSPTLKEIQRAEKELFEDVDEESISGDWGEFLLRSLFVRLLLGILLIVTGGAILLSGGFAFLAAIGAIMFLGGQVMFLYGHLFLLLSIWITSHRDMKPSLPFE